MRNVEDGGLPGRCNQREGSRDGKSGREIQLGSGSVLNNTCIIPNIIPAQHLTMAWVFLYFTFWLLMLSYLLLQLYELRWQKIEEAQGAAVSAAPLFPLGSPAWEQCRAAGRQDRQCRREPKHFLSPNWTDCTPSLPYSSPANQSFKMSHILQN